MEVFAQYSQDYIQQILNVLTIVEWTGELIEQKYFLLTNK